MAYFYDEPSRTFSEYLLLPNLTTKDCVPENVNLKTPIVRFKRGETSPLHLNIPLVSAIMQAVSGERMAIELARCGGLSFIYASQPIEAQAEMVKRVKSYKAGFVVSDSNLTPEHTLADVLALTAKTGHSTIAITDDGSPNGKLLGIVTSRDYRKGRTPVETKVKEFMTPFSEMVYGKDGLTLSEANDLIWEHKLNCLPIIDEEQRLKYLVFRKDYTAHKENPLELLDQHKRLMVGAGINTRDYHDRVPALVEAGADILCVDSSDGYSEWQFETIKTIKEKYRGEVKVGGGNVVDREAFLYLAEAGADFVKVGIGGGSICITREQKGIGRGQATAVIEVAKARDEYFDRTGIYIPICSDGGIVHDYHIVLALAMGADFVMLGRYFARFDESPTRKIRHGMNYVKEYWGEGSNRARNWARYDHRDGEHLTFEEGVDSYVPYAGKLKDNLDLTLAKIKSTMCNCGALTIPELQKKARLTLVSPLTLREGSAHDVILRKEAEHDFS
ncbi:MAG TPA: IMP dehydrogenase [Firmicutes bacterium]|uniref:IMP dehydrogenase n=1 Tax=Capillibacterium thermochitinicola TaxID=2699427 RepID=A0A8J6I0H0_9FIRM|nr:IMP dehydrogenase [Capillibacterium thermochitinicola]MBA2133181.1 IMP dehydrogenase [Capillibacterium thermochitinicola]HHW11724.1 IMP dehydrogenase [Bacillota bacterium]